jgi:predicted phosphodiesterase
VPAWEQHETYLYLNPGSVSIPKENSPHSYMVLEGRTLTWKDLEGTPYHQLTL